MLVLSRKAAERIHIGDDITIEVRRVAGNRVTLAIEAPRDIRILRGELEKAAKEFDETAATAEPEAESTPPSEAPASEPYVVTHHRAPLTGALPPSDMSDHGLSAYAVG